MYVVAKLISEQLGNEVHFLDRRYRDHAHTRRRSRRWRQETCHHGEHRITRRAG
jgi:hypothetical protein